MSESIVVQAPAQDASQLILLFHGVGASAAGLVPLGQLLAREFPRAAVVSVASPVASDLGSGRQWFSVRGITEDNRAERIAEVMPLFGETVREWQQRYGVVPAATALVGFSQGAIMALESARQGKALAGRIGSIAGRFAQLPDTAPEHCALHFIHGRNDPVIPYAHAVAAAERLTALGAGATVDIVPSAGHEITPAMAAILVERLRGRCPSGPAA